MNTAKRRPVRIANCSGFFGDRLSAAREMVDGGPIDVLTGDWLAELTMLILAKQRSKRPTTGYASTFLAQMEDVLGPCLNKGIRVVSNAGGLSPTGCAEELGLIADRLGLPCRIAYLTGDDILSDLSSTQARGERLTNLDTGEDFAEAGFEPISANAYLGAFGIAEALRRGADVVITGRVTDAALTVGPAVWHHDWKPHQLDALAGATVAGHVIECGAQTTGGNYAFFKDVPEIERCGFPSAEVADDGSSIITKHEATGGMVSVGTVTAQLLYEIGDHRYPNPDVVVRLDTVQLEQTAPNRVTISGTRGESAPERLKVAINYIGGYRNTMTFMLTGLDIEAKAAIAEKALWAAVDGGRDSFDQVHIELSPPVAPDGPTNRGAIGQLRIVVKDKDSEKVGRLFSGRAIETGLASYPGLFTATPPTPAAEFGVYWPTLVEADSIRELLHFEGELIPIPRSTSTAVILQEPDHDPSDIYPSATTTLTSLGSVIGARSGDKGGNVNVGLWAPDTATWKWLDSFLTTDRFLELAPETSGFQVERHRLPNLYALNFVIRGLLGRGVADSCRLDAQGKGFGEHLRARAVPIPSTLLDRNYG